MAGITRSYGQFVSTHHAAARTRIWTDLGRDILSGLPLIIGVPTIGLLVGAYLLRWRDDGGGFPFGYSVVVLLVNTAVLLGWGCRPLASAATPLIR